MSCLVVGYDGSGLYTRSFWPPEGAKYDAEEYFYSPDWYENCAGLLIVGKQTGKRLAGAEAYARIADWALEFGRLVLLPFGQEDKIFISTNMPLTP